jgi:hypothetical protein
MKILLILLALANLSSAETYSVPTSSSHLKIDGVLNDEIWNDALEVELKYEIDPGTNIEAEVQTKAYMVDTGKSLVFAFRALDPDPSQIRAFLRDRDSAYSDDFIGVMLDTYNDERRALEFFVNPLGVQMDLIRDDSNGGNEDDSWDAIWDSAGKITDNGYVVEFEIPYNEIQMANIEGEKTWGIVFFRSYPRDTRKQIQNTPNDRNNGCYLCQIDKFKGFANAERGMDLEITPSMTWISQQSREEVTDDYSSVDHNFEPSLDINWGITSNLTLNATINPDFSQVESDSGQLDVNQTFALFFPEKRPFFLENSDFFNTRLNLIYTRNVNSPDYGVRLVGKSAENAYGFFYANDESTNILIPGTFGSGIATLERESENMAARYRRDFGNSSTVGAAITRRSADDYSNTVASIDTFYRLTDEKAIIAQYVTTDSINPIEITEEFEQAAKTSGDGYYFRYRHSDENLFYHLTHNSYDDGFRSDLGFIGQVGYEKSIAGIQYTWRPETEKWWNRLSTYSDWDITHDQQGQLIEKELEASINLSAIKQSNFNINGYTRQRLWDEVMFDEKAIGLNANFKPVSGIYLGIGYDFGDSIDFSNTKLADREGAYFDGSFNIGKHFNVNLNHSYRKLSRDAGNVFVANQTDMRFSYQFNIRQRLKLSIINTNINRDVSLYEDDDIDSHSRFLNTQLIYSYKVNPKTLLFLGYSDAGIEDQDIDLTKTNRAFFAKFSYAFKK